MSRLIAFGCSFTYGHGLKDCCFDGIKHHKIDVMHTPSKFAWPQIAADMLDLECVNCSVSGTGNKQILYNIVNFEFKPNDIVVPMWTYFCRHMVLQDSGEPMSLGPWMVDKGSKQIQQSACAHYLTPGNASDLNDLFDNLMYIKCADAMLRNQHIKVIHSSIGPGIEFQHKADKALFGCVSDPESRRTWKTDSAESDIFISACNNWCTITPDLIFDDDLHFGIAEDGHPNEQAHASFAERLAQYITENVVDSP